MEKQADETWSLVAARLAGEATEQESAALDALLDSDPALQHALRYLEIIWGARDETPREDLNKSFEQILTAIRTRK